MPGSGGHLTARGGHMVAGSPVPGHFVNSIGAIQTSQGNSYLSHSIINSFPRI